MSGFKKVVGVCVAVLMCCAGVVSAVQAEEEGAFKTENERISYALGYNIGRNLQKDFKVDPDAFFQGFKESSGQETSLTDAQIKEAITAFQTHMREKQMTQMKGLAEKNKAEGAAFLKANSEKEGVVALESGLQYRIIEAGSGPVPKATDTVECHYRGTTIDGKEFDSSYKRGRPASFQVGGVIKGWTQALQLMKVGAKWELFIPSDLAYGDRGAGNAIAPGSTLLFEVELLNIK